MFYVKFLVPNVLVFISSGYIIIFFYSFIIKNITDLVITIATLFLIFRIQQVIFFAAVPFRRLCKNPFICKKLIKKSIYVPFVLGRSSES